MRIVKSPQRVMQLKLFHPPIRNPVWEELPGEVRQQIVLLLARLLREHERRYLAYDQAKQVRD
jgi:hypothetical protein